MHSPPRNITAKDQADWKIPPCISNWKNAKGYTIPLDKRLAADGRGLQASKLSGPRDALWLAWPAAVVCCCASSEAGVGKKELSSVQPRGVAACRPPLRSGMGDGLPCKKCRKRLFHFPASIPLLASRSSGRPHSPAWGCVCRMAVATPAWPTIPTL